MSMVELMQNTIKGLREELEAERERSKPLIAMLKCCRSVAAELNITKGGKRMDCLIDDVISAHEGAGKS